ncbi:MAG: GTP-binding protein [Terriglobia bacterium]
MTRVLIACVGGFLGSGKTTALVSAARELASRGLRVGVITNDQGKRIIDTQVMFSHGLAAEEIAGGCFCCKFNDLVRHAEQILNQYQPDIILAEAVGSCTDLAATVYQPLRRYYASRFDLAPLSILVEPARARTFFTMPDRHFPESVGYLFKKQLAEADLIVINKNDLIQTSEWEILEQTLKEVVGNIPTHRMSALQGDGVAAWVDWLLSGRTGGDRILEIDYDTYAQAEGTLGWLNATVEMNSMSFFSPRVLGSTLIEEIRKRCLAENGIIAHLKILVVTAEGSDRIALTENLAETQWSEGRQFIPVTEASVIVNARVCLPPERLQQMVEQSVAVTADALQARSKIQDLESFSPSPPKPTYRFKEATTA